MLSLSRALLLASPLFLVTAVAACGGDDSNPAPMTTSGGSAGTGGSSPTTTGGTGGASGSGGSGGSAGSTGGSGGNAGSGNGSRDAMSESSAGDATSVDASEDGSGGSTQCVSGSDPIDVYAPHLSKRGSGGALTFELVGSDVPPTKVGNTTWTMKVTQTDGGLLAGDLAAHVTMPYHTHPVTVQPVATFDAANGVYVVTPVYMYLSGYWRATFTAYAGAADAGAPLDTVDFQFCVDPDSASATR